MACQIINGYEIDCRDAVGGIKELYIAEYANVASYTETSGVCSAITMVSGKKFYTFQMEKENAELIETQTGSVENGTNFWQQDLTFTMKKLSAAKRNSVKVLSQVRLVVVAKLHDDSLWIVGRHNGLDMVGTNTAKSGKAMGDMNGYEIALMGKEQNPMYSYSGTVASITA